MQSQFKCCRFHGDIFAEDAGLVNKCVRVAEWAGGDCLGLRDAASAVGQLSSAIEEDAFGIGADSFAVEEMELTVSRVI